MFKPGIQITIRMPEELRKWLHREADRQMSSTSVLIRQAVLLLQKKIEREGELEASTSSGLNRRPPVGQPFPIDPEVK